MIKTLLICSVLVAFAFGANVLPKNGLDRYQVLSVFPRSHAHVEFLGELLNADEYDFWSPPRFLGTTDIMARPDQLPALIKMVESQGMTHEIKISNVGRIISQQKIANERIRANGPRALTWDRYNTFEEIENWLINDVALAPNVTLKDIGRSYEDEVLHQVIISTGKTADGKSKPIVYIDANIHAREWISSAVATYIINELAFNTTAYSSLLDKFDFYIVPVLNPDGFKHSHLDEPEGFRLWRKTRRPVLANPQCIGVDPNRNFPFHFGGLSTSDDPCSDIFRGEEPLSEPETKALHDDIVLLNKTEGGIHAYITLHAYGQLWLLSWGYTKNAFPRDYEDLFDWGRKSTQAIYSINQKKYTFGQGADMLYGVGGASDDWAKSIGIKYVTTLEMRDFGKNGFLLPPDQIIPTAKECWEGIQVIGTTVDSGVESISAKHWFIGFQLLVVARYFM